jgi:hypothetical protein
MVVASGAGSGGWNDAGGKTICTTVAAFGDCGLVEKGEGTVFRAGLHREF